MEVRYFIEMTIFAALTFVFQYYITIFASDYHYLVIDVHEWEFLISTQHTRDEPEMIILEERIREEVDHAVFDLNEAMYMSIIAIAFPIR
eukprot:CAMPEP_0116877658 /NCGR_PEP_ID=MMETSP0463-20121206/9410_1 /TAXON_ID=181622 /ORGANISM="Strombidinopsis sp, Strain SopsisLIS2011" /LENGTH=89 /DNA_ID=CAMNT_0004525103 /DNA_START=2188 /DNA_END=2457 /DNA_ORIENTATION=+